MKNAKSGEKAGKMTKNRRKTGENAKTDQERS